MVDRKSCDTTWENGTIAEKFCSIVHLFSLDWMSDYMLAFCLVLLVYCCVWLFAEQTDLLIYRIKYCHFIDVFIRFFKYNFIVVRYFVCFRRFATFFLINLIIKSYYITFLRRLMRGHQKSIFSNLLKS